MGGAIGRGRRAGRDRTRAAAASLLAHLAALAALGRAVAPLRWTPPPSPPQPAVVLDLHPSTRAAAATATAAALDRTTTARALHAGPAATAPAAVAKPATTDAAPQRPGAAAAPSFGAEAGATRGPAADGVVEEVPAPGVRDALRGLLACGSAGEPDRSPEVRTRCAERLGLASRTAPRVDAIPAEKRAYYDAVTQAYAKAHAPPSNAPAWLKREPRADVLADKGGLTIPLIGCEMKFGAPRGYKSYHQLPPHALKLFKLGALPCFAPPPSGRGFEESGVEAPASLRERTDDAAHMKALDAPKP